MSADHHGVRCDTVGSIARITLCRPETRNSQTPDTWAALRGIGAKLDPGVRVVVVTGEGESFSSGLDRALFTPEGRDGTSLLSIATGDPAAARAFIEDAQQAFAWLHEREAVSIAAVRGHAIGAGFQLALACDLIIASSTASFAMREIAYGIVPDLGGTHPLVRRIGVDRALELCITGRAVDAEEAFATGLVTQAVEDGMLETRVDLLAAAILEASEPATRELPGLLRGAAERTAAQQRLAEQDAQLRVFAAMRDSMTRDAMRRDSMRKADR